MQAICRSANIMHELTDLLAGPGRLLGCQCIKRCQHTAMSTPTSTPCFGLVFSVGPRAGWGSACVIRRRRMPAQMGLGADGVWSLYCFCFPVEAGHVTCAAAGSRAGVGGWVGGCKHGGTCAAPCVPTVVSQPRSRSVSMFSSACSIQRLSRTSNYTYDKLGELVGGSRVMAQLSARAGLRLARGRADGAVDMVRGVTQTTLSIRIQDSPLAPCSCIHALFRPPTRASQIGELVQACTVDVAARVRPLSVLVPMSAKPILAVFLPMLEQQLGLKIKATYK